MKNVINSALDANDGTANQNQISNSSGISRVKGPDIAFPKLYSIASYLRSNSYCPQ